MLKHNVYLPVYRSIECSLENDFMTPSYKESVLLQRGSGYFSLRSLILSIDGIIPFIENNGYIQLVCNPCLSQEDINLIIAGQSLDKEHITNDLLRQLESEGDFSPKDLAALDVICNMIYEKRLEIRVAFMPIGIYHEKIGIFTDAAGCQVYFSGSANETVNAKLYNAESIDVTTSWTGDGDAKKVQLQVEYFERLWNNKLTDRLQVISFPEAVEKKLFSAYKKSEHLTNAIDSFQKQQQESKKKVKELYPYQKIAIQEFVDNGYAHFYEMATGTGKTFTSVKTVERVCRDKGRVFVVVCVPQTDLQTQWAAAFKEAGVDNLYLLGGLNNGRDCEIAFSEAQISYFAEDKTTICIAVYETFFSKIYSECYKFDNLFFIVDEAHNLTPQNIGKIPANVSYKLGLSATIERFNQFETDSIIKFFTNGTVKPYYYGIEEAIDNGFLSHYEYYPIIVRLTDDEEDRYRKKSRAIATELSAKVPDMEKVQRLRNERSLIVKQASNKLLTLRDTIAESYPMKNSVVYCGQGKDGEDSIIDIATSIIHNAGFRVSQFTSKTPDRAAVLQKFEDYYYDVLVAIKCFDEGVDVPKLDKIYIMASDGSMRQTVQRRGRVLRICAESGKTIARIYDMITLPQPASSEGNFSSMVGTELARAMEYNRLANNKKDNDVIINDIINQYHIQEEDFNNEDQSN